MTQIPQERADDPNTRFRTSGVIRIEELTIEVVTPRFTHAFGISSGEVAHIDSLTVQATTENAVGFGEAVAMPPYTGQTLAGMRDVVENVLRPVVIGLDARDITTLRRVMDRVVRGQSLAKAAVEMAAYDLVSRILGLPLAAYLGASTGPVASTWVIGLGVNEQELIEDATAAVQRGYRDIKLKGGVDADRDLAVTTALIKELPPDVAVSIDLNGGYHRRTAIEYLPHMAGIGVRSFEQPLPGDDVGGLYTLRDLRLPIILDESVQSIADVVSIGRERLADAVNIKLLKFGGLRPAQTAIAVAEALGMSVKMGTMPELGIATRAAAHLARLIRPDRRIAGDFVGPLMVESDPYRGEIFEDNGTLRLDNTAGLGRW